ncbi:hypothetical protein MA04_02744 [Alcanivorax balearicus MACL04]|uniref:Uncharacterized protein n=1 Tax=Alloalcanivorax balearicus MACL04 TaxID=1177182 RepID=A0ABT2R126_9GAMM|nr:hypothetical protein [Alloalcanivorax balearicus MACL04]
MQRRKDEKLAQVIQSNQILLRNEASQYKLRTFHTLLLGKFFKLNAVLRSHRAYDGQLMIFTYSSWQTRIGTNETFNIFPVINTTRIHDIGLLQPVLISELPLLIKRNRDLLKFIICRRGNVINSILGKVQMLYTFVSSRF